MTSIRVSTSGAFFPREFRNGDPKIIKEIDLDEQTAELALSVNYAGTCNRRFSRKRANFVKMCHDMKNGNWKENGEAIKFSWDDERNQWLMIDGQHRCRAVLETGVTVRTLVVFGVPRSAMATIDSSVPRSTRDQVVISDELRDLVEIASVYHVADTISAICFKQTNLSNSERIELAMSMKEELRFFLSSVIPGRKAGVTAAVSGAFVRALCNHGLYRGLYATRDEFWAKLAKGGEILLSGVCTNPKDQALADLRTYLIDLKVRSRGRASSYVDLGAEVFRRQIAERSEQAIDAYLRGAPFSGRGNLRGVSRFPLPEKAQRIVNSANKPLEKP